MIKDHKTHSDIFGLQGAPACKVCLTECSFLTAICVFDSSKHKDNHKLKLDSFALAISEGKSALSVTWVTYEGIPYIKDCLHTLQSFRDFKFLGEDKLIFTMNISPFYTVIPNGEDPLALKHFFDLRTVKNQAH